MVENEKDKRIQELEAKLKDLEEKISYKEKEEQDNKEKARKEIFTQEINAKKTKGHPNWCFFRLLDNVGNTAAGFYCDFAWKRNNELLLAITDFNTDISGKKLNPCPSCPYFREVFENADQKNA